MKIIRSVVETIIPILAILMACFYPTSLEGKIFEAQGTIIYYLISSLIIITLFVKTKYDKKNIYIGTFFLIYLTVVTFISVIAVNTNFSIARFAPVFLSLILFMIKIKTVPNFNVLKGVLEVISIVILLWNIGILIGQEALISFTINSYSQFNDFTVSYGLSIGKTIFTFGAHTFASFFYMLIFYMWYITIKRDKKNRKFRYVIYLLGFLIFTVLLKSSAALLFSIMMILLLFDLIKGSVNKIFFIFASVITSIFLLNSFLIDVYRGMVTSSTNGVIPRYFSENNIFSANFSVLKENILGIGFTIPRDYAITYTDSGYLVYFTMGNIVFVIVIYYMLYRFLKNNIETNFKVIFLIILLFELAIPSLIYMKTTYFLIFLVYYLKSLNEKVKKNEYEY
ncbi:hypothetical protein [Planococcus soli]|uniref:hypothetical protein n=1 Tax=Planococcus soli TaxID=2666072 RepID=UPI00115DC0ED|nr:hypothetical protein [Planococcus soli]